MELLDQGRSDDDEQAEPEHSERRVDDLAASEEDQVDDHGGEEHEIRSPTDRDKEQMRQDRPDRPARVLGRVVGGLGGVTRRVARIVSDQAEGQEGDGEEQGSRPSMLGPAPAVEHRFPRRRPGEPVAFGRLCEDRRRKTAGTGSNPIGDRPATAADLLDPGLGGRGACSTWLF